MEQYYKFEDENKEKTCAFIKSVIEAVNKTREITKQCEMKTKELTEVIYSNDKERMKNTLQDYLKKYWNKIIKLNYIKVIYVNKENYDQFPVEACKQQLYILKGIIYLDEAANCAAKETIKNNIKKKLKSSGMFTDKEIKLFLT